MRNEQVRLANNERGKGGRGKLFNFEFPRQSKRKTLYFEMKIEFASVQIASMKDGKVIISSVACC